MARLARRRVIHPIRIAGSLAVAGAVAGLLALAGIPVPRAFLAMTAALALGFAVNRRPTERPRRPALRRGAWIGVAAVMLAAIPSDVPRGSAAWGFAISELELVPIAVVALSLLAAVVTIARGILSDREDRLLVGMLAGIIAFVVLFVRVPPPGPAWLYPFALLVGAAVARARGNIRRP